MNQKIQEILNNEIYRQQNNIELIASENYVSKAILELQGSIFTNKYAEGYPGKRYYGGCENVDEIESLAISYVCELFGSKYANVQPHSGSSANMAVYKALLNEHDTVLGLNLTHGGHLTHGHKVNFSGLDYNFISYNVNSKTGLIDYDDLKKKALEYKPKMIVAGASAYSRIIDFAKIKEICNEIGALLLVDMAHIAGLVAAGLHPNPCSFADVVTSTTHKTLRGPRGGFILTNDENIIKKVNKAIFPGIQGGPLMHVIAAKAQCFYEALQPEFKDYQNQVIKNAQSLAECFKENSIAILTNGTDNHLLLIDVKKSFNITGQEAEDILSTINITVNKNTIIDDTEARLTSGIRIGTPAMTTRGLKEEDFKLIGQIIIKALQRKENLDDLKEQVLAICTKYPADWSNL
ncbi:MAG: serine hydroxymethyltransferase [Bacilli bacterium]|nr:serine hydroxymethyltransferase [Bacilli bacterium]